MTEKIVPEGGKALEHHMADAIHACCLTKPYGERTHKQLRFELQDFIELTDADKEVANKRLAELKWHTVMRNVHRTLSKDPNAFDRKLTALPGCKFAVTEIYEARKAKEAAIWGKPAA